MKKAGRLKVLIVASVLLGLLVPGVAELNELQKLVAAARRDP